MQQLFQDLKTGEIYCKTLPRPLPGANEVLIRTLYSLVSPGTERMLLEFGKSGWIAKARQQPDKVREAIQKAKADGIGPTIKAIQNKLNQPLPLGYSNVGIVEEVGSDVIGFKKGMRVLSNGPHAELALVPYPLCCPIPDEVSSEDAVFGILASISLQGTRLLKPELGEIIAVIGLGLLGLISIQLLRANGCKVIAFDLNPERVKLAAELGAIAYRLDDNCDPVRSALEFSNNIGVDGVLICAATPSNQPIELAPRICRKRGRVILIGVVGLELSRKDFFDKEISFQVSCSYGPGRYDDAYERRAVDYPIGYVRWTEERNIAAVIELIKENKLSFSKYITNKLHFEQASRLYQELLGDSSQLGILFLYPSDDRVELHSRLIECKNLNNKLLDKVAVSFVGTGNHTRGCLAPAFKKAGAELRGACSRTGTSSQKLAEDLGFSYNTTDSNRVFTDNKTDAVIISTRHDTHADYCINSLNGNKHVFVEKPLATSFEQLKRIEEALISNPTRILAVGFNRRFAPATKNIVEKLEGRSAPIAIVMTINSGAIPLNNWNNDALEGGGRIIGEACHFVDLAQALTRSQIAKVFCQPFYLAEDGALNNAIITLEFSDGSVASIQYLCNGSKTFPKEKIQVFYAGKIFEIENFAKLKGFAKGQDKGHEACAKAFLDAISTGNKSAFDPNLTIHISLACLAVKESARREQPIFMREFLAGQWEDFEVAAQS